VVSKSTQATAIADEPEKRLTKDEGWNLIFSLFGTAKDLYAPYGGGDSWLRAERDAWANKDAAS
jgi:hypothetical protein